jgi:thiopurine S-methyltransferase
LKSRAPSLASEKTAHFWRWKARVLGCFAAIFFALEPKHTADVAAVYDRAALIALPRELRRHYVEHLRSLLAPNVPMLLLTFEYPSHEIDGPLFSVNETEVRALYVGQRKVRRLECTDRLADETKLANRGLTRLVEHAFLLAGL